MNESPPSETTAPHPGGRQIVSGIAVMIGWGLVHLALFYMFFASGAVIDVLLGVVKSVMFPGLSGRPGGAHEMLGWSGFLLIGLIIAGAAGVPAGMAMFCTNRRKMLRRLFWIVLAVGALFEIYALFILVRNALSVPA